MGLDQYQAGAQSEKNWGKIEISEGFSIDCGHIFKPF